MVQTNAEADAAYCLDQVRRFDRDRYLTALFATPQARADLLALYAFNLEVAKTREMVREPMMGLMRLQWWRDCIAETYAGNERRHQVAQPLAAAIRRHALSREHFDRLIDAREQDMSPEPPVDLPALVAYAGATAGNLGLLAVETLAGTRPAETSPDVAVASAVSGVWTAHALIGLLRAVPHHARQHRIYLPQTLMREHHVEPHELLDLRQQPGLAIVARSVAEEAGRLLDASGRIAARPPKPLLPAFLPATLARAYLAQLRRAGYDLFDARLHEPPPWRIWRLLFARLRGRF
jgi:NADH dehydrogenase [ubiquinone] 1 alpha subcomplex assembly factor 6